MSFDAVLFDLDGTLIHTLPDITDAINAMRADFGLAAMDKDAAAHYIGKGDDHLIQGVMEYAGSPVDATRLEQGIACFRHHYDSLNGRRAKLFPGVAEGLAMFQKQGSKLAIVTNKITRFTPPVLEKTGLSNFFEVVVCGDTCKVKKPDPAPIYHACEQLGVSPQRALFIGDSANDALAAQAANMPMLILPYGYSEGQKVADLPATRIITSLVEGAHWAQHQTRPA